MVISFLPHPPDTVGVGRVGLFDKARWVFGEVLYGVWWGFCDFFLGHAKVLEKLPKTA